MSPYLSQLSHSGSRCCFVWWSLRHRWSSRWTDRYCTNRPAAHGQKRSWKGRIRWKSSLLSTPTGKNWCCGTSKVWILRTFFALYSRSNWIHSWKQRILPATTMTSLLRQEWLREMSSLKVVHVEYWMLFEFELRIWSSQSFELHRCAVEKDTCWTISRSGGCWY